MGAKMVKSYIRPMNEGLPSTVEGEIGFARALISFRVRKIMVLLVLTFVGTFLDAVLLGGIKLFTDIVSGKESIFVWKYEFPLINSFAYWVLIMAIIALLKLIFSYLKMVRSGDLFIAFEKYYQKKMLILFPHLGNEKLRKESPEEIGFRFNSDFRVLEKGTDAVFLCIHAVIQLAVFIPVLFLISWKLSAIILFCMAPIVAIAQNRLVVLNKPIERLLQYRGVIHHKLTQYLSLLMRWTHSQSLRGMNAYMHSMVSEMANKEKEVIHKKAVIFGVSEFIANSGTVFVFAIAGYYMLSGELSGDNLILFLACLFLLYKPAKEFARVLPLYKDAEIAWNNIVGLFDHEQQFVKPVNHANPEIVFESVSFAYTDNEYIYKDFAASLPLDKPVLISGANGTGKSTVLKLIANIEKCQTGRILYPEGKTMVGYLDQDPLIPFLPLTALISNELNDSQEVLLSALKVDTLLNDLKHKNISQLSDIGRELSGGQRQRLALAIMLLSDENMLLLDEPTSYIPALERVNVIQAVINYCEKAKKSIIIVSHEPFLELDSVYRVDWDGHTVL